MTTDTDTPVTDIARDSELARVKDQQLATWSAGDFTAVAPYVEDAATVAVDALAPAAGDRVLDVATGNGNAALLAAARGARVTGLDFVASLLAAARDRAAEAGLDLTLVEGDAEALPFADAAFDRVVSVFGVQFAPRHAVAAAELLRVCRPGGTIALASWTPEGLIGQMFKAIGGYMPTPPAFVSPPPLWGSEDHVGELLGGGADLSFSRHTVSFRFDSLDAYVEHFERHYGPSIKTREKLAADGSWEACRAELRDLYERGNQATDGSLHIESEYLLAVGTRTGG